MYVILIMYVNLTNAPFTMPNSIALSQFCYNIFYFQNTSVQVILHKNNYEMSSSVPYAESRNLGERTCS